MSTVLRSIFVYRLWVSSLSIVEDIWHLQLQEARDLAEINTAREYGREKEGEGAVQIAQGSRDPHWFLLVCEKQILESLS